jgi:GNAT superfamily N-acetyltransferase
VLPLACYNGTQTEHPAQRVTRSTHGKEVYVDASVAQLSPIDDERFGIRTVRANGVTRDNLLAVMTFCEEHDARLLIARVPVSDLVAVQTLESYGCQLMDTLVYYECVLTKTPIQEDTCSITVRPMHLDEADAVREVAALAFMGYHGHYHADPRLDRTKCDETYADWAARASVSRGDASEVLVAKYRAETVGFATLRLNSPNEGEGVLFGVHPAAEGKGLYRSFMIHGMKWCLEKGATRMVVSTQLTNTVVQKHWARLGFALTRAYYTMHGWFTPRP